MLYLVRSIKDGTATPDFTLFGAMVYYIDAFPERFHHPKEETYLFRLLRLRYPAAGSLLDVLDYRVPVLVLTDERDKDVKRCGRKRQERFDSGGVICHHPTISMVAILSMDIVVSRTVRLHRLCYTVGRMP